jgi:hypothetical protein
MIPQLVARVAAANGISLEAAGGQVLTADPFDVLLEMELVWDRANLGSPNPPPAGRGRRFLFGQGEFFDLNQPPQNAPATPNPPAWHHLGYSLAIENTRAAQILARVVRLFRTGESLGIPGHATQRWVDTTEALLVGARPGLGWSPGSPTPADAEGERRNAYWRLFGMDLAHGTEANTPYPYEKAAAANTTFVALLEELLFELWKAIENVRNLVGANQTDDDRIFRLAEQLAFMLRSRRQNALLGWTELVAATAMGWLDLTLSSDNPVIRDLRADATNAADRLRIIGTRVGLPAHSKAASFFSMSAELSLLLRTLEARAVQDETQSWLLYRDNPAPAIGAQVRRVITEWSAASGRSLKDRARPVIVATRSRALTRS